MKYLAGSVAGLAASGLTDWFGWPILVGLMTMGITVYVLLQDERRSP